MHLNIAAFCGAGVVFPGLLLYVAGRFGRDKVLLFCAGFLLNVPLLSIFMRPFETSEDGRGDSGGKSGREPFSAEETYSSLVNHSVSGSTESILRKPLFYITALTHIFFFYVFNLIATVAIDAALRKNIPITLAVIVVPAASVFDCIGRIVLPMVSDAGYVTQPVLIVVDYAVVAMGLLILSLVRDYPRMFLAGVGMGYFKDAHDSYSTLYYATSGVILFNALLWLAVIVTLARIKRKTWTASDKLVEDRDAPSLVTYRSVDLTSLMA
ncbi:hypothetical protein V5799_032791 [Amblyomma americanum]|uniref:Monocarboxylate transporter n=1 Tax=Amblyomma americanum TaxID=6943 RepID=A0AAQ4DQ60_AMBAM